MIVVFNEKNMNIMNVESRIIETNQISKELSRCEEFKGKSEYWKG